MNIYSKLIERANEKFVGALIPGRSKFAFRPGYFYIQAITFRKIGVFGEIAIGQINWKPKSEDAFLEDVVFEVALSSLHSLPPNEVKPEWYYDLIGKTIYANQPFRETRVIEGVEREVLRCNWDFVKADPKFISQNNAAIYAFAGSAKTLLEAHQNFLATANYDVASAEEFEAECGYLGDTPLEGCADKDYELIEDVFDDTIIEDFPDNEHDSPESNNEPEH